MITDDIQIKMEYDERKKEMTFITPNDDKEEGILRTFKEVYSEKALKNFWNYLNESKKQINAIIQRNEKLVTDVKERSELIKKDLLKQGIGVSETLTDEQHKLKANLQALQEWNKVYGEPQKQVETAQKTIEQEQKKLTILNRRIEEIRAKAKNLNLK